MNETPLHLRPEACYICGYSEAQHTTVIAPEYSPAGYGGHAYWSNADAKAEFDAEDAREGGPVYASGARTPEAAYVNEHRPY